MYKYYLQQLPTTTAPVVCLELPSPRSLEMMKEGPCIRAMKEQKELEVSYHFTKKTENRFKRASTMEIIKPHPSRIKSFYKRRKSDYIKRPK